MVRRLLVTGSREYTDRSMIEGAIRQYMDLPELTTLVHGDARGADRLAESVARSLHLSVESHPADWQQFGRSAGVRRNEYMVSLGAYCVLAFPTPSSVGTWDCIRRAAGAGIVVHVYPQV